MIAAANVAAGDGRLTPNGMSARSARRPPRSLVCLAHAKPPRSAVPLYAMAEAERRDGIWQELLGVGGPDQVPPSLLREHGTRDATAESPRRLRRYHPTVDSNAFEAAQWQSAVDLIVGLAWPVVVLIVAVAFRSQAVGLLAKLSRFKGFGMEAEFDAKLAEGAPTLATVTTPATAGRATGIGTPHNATASVRQLVTARLADTARGEPVLAVIVTYAEVEEALRRRLREAKVAGVERLSGAQLIDEALIKGAIGPESAEAVRRSLEVRNLALHVDPVHIDTARALQNLEQCNILISNIETWPRNSDGKIVEAPPLP
jgi:hypothetical protein